MGIPINLLSENFVKTRNINKNTKYEIVEIDASKLICPERFDLAAKIAYIEAKENGGNLDFAKELYKKHIEAFSEGYFCEPGDEDKTSIDDFFLVFDNLIESFKNEGFDSEKSLVPIGKNNIILDGAHRTACAIYFNKKIKGIKFDEFEVNFNYDYFRNRRLSEEMLEYMAVCYSRYSNSNLYFACMWPISNISKRNNAFEIISEQYRIVFSKDIMLNKNGLHNFMAQIYQHQDWIGTPEDHFTGVNGKVDACYYPGNSTKVVIFEGGNLNQVLQLKEKVRNVFGLDKHSIHISDSKEESKLMSELLLNENSRHALNYGNPHKFSTVYYAIKNIKQNCKIANDNVTLLYYGLADYNSADKYTSSSEKFDKFNPRTYFVYDELFLPSLSSLKLKLKGDEKQIDIYRKVCDLLKKSDSRGTNSRLIEDLKTKLVWKTKHGILNIKVIAMKVTKKIGIYNFLHKLHKK